MDELAHWIISVGTGALLGLGIGLAITLFIRLAEALPNRIPLVTPAWEAIKRPIQRMVDKLPR